jgi:hypothetical protein
VGLAGELDGDGGVGGGWVVDMEGVVPRGGDEDGCKERQLVLGLSGWTGPGESLQCSGLKTTQRTAWECLLMTVCSPVARSILDRALLVGSSGLQDLLQRRCTS